VTRPLTRPLTGPRMDSQNGQDMIGTTATGTTTPLGTLEAELTRAVVERRPEREQRILSSLSCLAPDAELDDVTAGWDAFDHALLHHAFQQTQVAMRTRDAERARRAIRLWQGRGRLREQAIPTAVGPVLVVDAEQCAAVDDERLGSQMYLLDTELPDMPAAERDRIARTLNTAVDTALAVGSDVLRSSTAIVIRTAVCELEETSRSYTFDFLPGTVVLSWTEEPLRLGETLVHEATHSWLNESLSGEGVVFPDGPRFHSPWRNEERPLFGIVHAALAFAKVIQYLSRIQLAPDDPSTLAAVLRQRLADERESLAIGYEAAVRSFAFVTSDRLRTYLRAAVEEAHGSA
jgi:HEXXH motif-containing protein